VKHVIFTLNIGDYAPELCAMTYPLMRLYAQKCGAEFKIITERKYPGWPIVYEKMQIYELGRPYDLITFLDSDALIHPETPNWFDHLAPHTVAHNGTDPAFLRWRYDEYFRRDGRNIGSCNWNTWAPRDCIDLWTPLDIPFAEARENIFPVTSELVPARAEAKQCDKCKFTFTEPQIVMDENDDPVLMPQVMDRGHLIDDYTLSRNIARYGLKVETLIDLEKKIGMEGSHFFYHNYTSTIEAKVLELRGVAKRWRVEKYIERLK
jgi:hypothetical protein